MKLTFNNDTSNPGFVGPLTKEDTIKIGEALGLTRERLPDYKRPYLLSMNGVVSDITVETEERYENAPVYSTENESILLECGYGISFDETEKDRVEKALIELGYL